MLPVQRSHCAGSDQLRLQFFLRRERLESCEVHGHCDGSYSTRSLFCSDSSFFHRNKSFCWQSNVVKDIEADPEGSEGRILQGFEVIYQTLISTKGLRVYSRSPCREGLFSCIQVRNDHLVREKKQVRHISLYMSDFTVGGKIPSQRHGG